MQTPKPQSDLWKLIGKAIAQGPKEVLHLLDRHTISLRKREDSKELLEGVLIGLGRNDKVFNRELLVLLSSYENEDQFIGAIAGAIGSVAGAIGSGQQKKAMKEQARAQTFSSIMSYKAQQDANRIEELKLKQMEKAKSQPPQGFQHKTLVIVIGVVIAALIIGLVYYQRSQPLKTIQPLTQPIRK